MEKRHWVIICLWLTLILTDTAICSVGNFTISNRAPHFAWIDHPTRYSNLGESLPRPIPTNQWWTNAILGDGSATIIPLPYQIQLRKTGISIGAPEDFTANSHSIDFPFSESLRVSSQAAPNSFAVVGFDELSLRVSWSAFQSTFVRGAAFITVSYIDNLPLISSPHLGFKRLAPANTSNNSSSLRKYRLEMSNGAYWLLYCSQEIQLKLANNTIVGFGALSFRGTVQIGYLSKDMRNTSSYFGNGEEIFDRAAGVYVRGAKVSYEMTSANSATIRFHFETNVTGGNDENNLLLFALPHHIDAMSYQIRIAWPRAVRTIRGKMTAVWGSDWHLIEAHLASHIEFSSATRLVDNCSKKEIIRLALIADTAKLEITPTDPYFFGKAIARIARLMLIAEEIGEYEIAQKCRQFGRAKIDEWLLSNDIFRYDRTWGGVVTARSVRNPANDFGMGWYNDHHYHYGYFLYAAAAFASSPSSSSSDNNETNSAPESSGDWLRADSLRYDAILSLARDIGNPSAEDSYFPITRHMDWFEGHSWAQGISVSLYGKNQESTSEAINAYYSLSLLGKVLDNSNLRDFGRVLLAMESRSARKYYHVMTNDDVIYDVSPSFMANRVVGILWGNRVEYNTWFGSNTEFIHCIQMLPFTPIMETTLSSEWISASYPVLATSLKRSSPVIDSGWRSFVYQAHAVIDREAAWSEIRTVQQFDDGSSAAISFYWIATRPTSATNQNDIKRDSVREEAERIEKDNQIVKRKEKAPSVSAFSAKINFQPEGSFTPWTYLADSGLPFGAREGTNLRYGWNKMNNLTFVRQTNRHWSPLYQSFIRMPEGFQWEIQVPMGTYNVKIGLGDPDRSNCHSVTIENLSPAFLSGCTNSSSDFPYLVSDLKSVTVLDGRLTISGLYDDSDDVTVSANKLLFIEIYSCDGQVVEIELSETNRKRQSSVSSLSSTSLYSDLFSEITTEPSERFHILRIASSKSDTSSVTVTCLIKSSGAFSYITSSASLADRIVSSAPFFFSSSGFSLVSAKILSNFRYKDVVPKPPASSSSGWSSFEIVSVVAGVVTGLIAMVLIVGGAFWYRRYRARLRAQEEFDLEMRTASDSPLRSITPQGSTDRLLNLPPVTLSQSELAPPIKDRDGDLRKDPEPIPAAQLPVTTEPRSVAAKNGHAEFVDVPLNDEKTQAKKEKEPTPTPRLVVQPPTPPTPTRHLFRFLRMKQNSAPSLINLANPPPPPPPTHQSSTPQLRQFLEVPTSTSPRTTRRPSLGPSETKTVGI